MSDYIKTNANGTSNEGTPSLAQAIRMKELSREGKLDMDTIFSIMTEQKGNQHEKIKIPMVKIKQYFPENELPSRVEAKIIAALEFYQQYHGNPPVSMLIGGAAVFIPQFTIAMLSKTQAI